MTIKPGVMACLDDDALLRSIEPTTPLEIELARRLSIYADQETPEQIHKSYESEMEQSEFRRQLLNEILILCDQSEDLCDDILIAIDSSPARLWEEPVADGE